MKFSGTSILGLAALLFILTVQIADARTVIRSGETVSVAEDQLIDGDFYGAAGKLNVSGVVEEDLLIAGGQVKVNGNIGDNATIVAGQVDFDGVVADDLRILAGEVVVSGPVEGDLFIVGGSVQILSTAPVTGDVILFAGDAVIESSVGGDVLGTVESLRIDGSVQGDIDVSTATLVLGETASITGAVKYTSNELVTQAAGASVGGDIVRNDPVLPSANTTLRGLLVPVLVLLFSTLSWYLISRKTLNQVAQRSIVKSPRPILIGFISLVCAPFGIVVLLMSMIGTMVGLIGLFGYITMLLMAVTATPAVAGALAMRSFKAGSAQLSLLSVVTGVVIVSVLALLPIVGQLALFLLLMVVFGAMIDLILRPGKKS